MTPNMFWVEVDDIDFDSLEEPLMLWPQNSELVGNALCDFTTMDGEDPKLAVCEPVRKSLSLYDDVSRM